MGYRFCILFLFFVSCLTASEAPGRGALIITYHTGRNGERLDRVRIRLINEQKAMWMYPVPGTFQDGTGARVRRITIPDLPAGNYTIEFVVPNQDGLFVPSPKREVTIANSEITKIDQGLKPRYARVRVTADIPSGSGKHAPTIRLSNQNGSVQLESRNGVLNANDLLPGQYTVWFDRHKGLTTPDPIHFIATPGAILGPFERTYK